MGRPAWKEARATLQKILSGSLSFSSLAFIKFWHSVILGCYLCSMASTAFAWNKRDVRLFHPH
jgi:hypothetical protein